MIEHLVDYDQFLAKIFSVLKSKGSLWLSTPNYGFFLLPFLERTVLEAIARISHFTRKDIHPSRFNESKLKSAVYSAGFNPTRVLVTPFKLALTISASK